MTVIALVLLAAIVVATVAAVALDRCGCLAWFDGEELS